MGLQDALLILIYISLIVFIISLIVLCIKLIGTLHRVDYLLSNITKKAESLDGLFDIIENATNKVSMISNTFTRYFGNIFGKLFTRNKIKRNKKMREENIYE